MSMRTVSLVAVVWSLVGVPAFCQAGVLVACCASEVAAHETSHDAPNECPNKCPDENREKCPDDTGASGPRECHNCEIACNAISLHSKQTSDDDVAAKFVSVMPVTQVLGDAYLPHQDSSRDPGTLQLRAHLPIPVSDRPLLI